MTDTPESPLTPLAIGFIGLGVMGAPMAGHLARAGHRLTLLDADGAVARRLADQLGSACQAAGISDSEVPLEELEPTQ